MGDYVIIIMKIIQKYSLNDYGFSKFVNQSFLRFKRVNYNEFYKVFHNLNTFIFLC